MSIHDTVHEHITIDHAVHVCKVILALCMHEHAYGHAFEVCTADLLNAICNCSWTFSHIYSVIIIIMDQFLKWLLAIRHCLDA